ncbi:MAG: hypothetical protein ACYCXI_04560, partial [Dethiobacteraceae bacterium]
DILLHLNLWVVRNHDPPVDKLVKNIPDKTEFYELIQFTEKMQLYNAYEDDYSQVTEYAE